MKVCISLEKTEDSRNIKIAEFSSFATSITKKLLDYSNDMETHRMYHFSEDKMNKKTKDFATAIISKSPIKDCEVKGDNLLYYITTNEQLIPKIYNNYRKAKKEIIYKDMIFKITDFKLIQDIIIDNNAEIFKTISNIVIKNKNNKYLFYDDEGFEESFNYMCNVILNNNRGCGLRKNIDFIPINMRKKVSKIMLQRNGIDVLQISSNQGEFVLQGDKCDLADLQKLGVGLRRGEGFGMIMKQIA